MSPATAAFAEVLLRGVALCGQAVAVGGVGFAFWVLRGGTAPEPALGSLRRRALGLMAAAAGGLALVQACLLVLHLAVLGADEPWPIREVAETTYFRAGVARMAGAAGLAGAAWAMRAGGVRPGGAAALAALSGVIAIGSAWISHASARLEHGEPLLALNALHQVAASVWLGGLVHLTAAAFRRRGDPWPAGVLRRFSGLALSSVALLVATGFGLSALYIDGFGGLVGTAYGLMVVTKGLLLVGLLGLGAVNFQIVRRLRAGAPGFLQRVRWFVEVEIGLGLTVLFAAASLTSMPPAVDVVADRATLAEIGARFTPRWPSFSTPAVADMPTDDREVPRTDADRAFSEYNHHVSGLFVLAMGVLASLHVLGRAGWARHWPLMFLGLAALILVRGDPGAWPLGTTGFWESMRYPEVLQHRLFAGLVVLFGVFEWLVRTERLERRIYAFAFPLLCSVGGALLLTHSHALLDLKSEFLTEVTHVPLGLLALLVGWARWLELRLPPPDDRVPRGVWAAGLALVGLLLLIYRES